MKKSCLHWETPALGAPLLPSSSRPHLVPFLTLTFQSNSKPCQDSEAGMGPWKCSHYCTFRFQMGCIGDQRTLWWNRIVTAASFIGSITCYQIIPQAVALEQALHMAFCCLGTFPGRVHLRVSRCCRAHVGCGQHSGGLKYVGFSPNWTDRLFPTLDTWQCGRQPSVVSSPWGSCPGIIPSLCMWSGPWN